MDILSLCGLRLAGSVLYCGPAWLSQISQSSQGWLHPFLQSCSNEATGHFRHWKCVRCPKVSEMFKYFSLLRGGISLLLIFFGSMLLLRNEVRRQPQTAFDMLQHYIYIYVYIIYFTVEYCRYIENSMTSLQLYYTTKLANV